MTRSRQTKLTIGAAVAAVVSVLLGMLAFDLSFERAVLLAPVLVIGFGVIAGMIIFWGKVAIMQLRGEDQVPPPRRDRDRGRRGSGE